jgi:hypothetical protein
MTARLPLKKAKLMKISGAKPKDLKSEKTKITGLPSGMGKRNTLRKYFKEIDKPQSTPLWAAITFQEKSKLIER